MTSDANYATARRRAEAKYGFFVHATVFAAVMILLIVIDLVTSPEVTWFIWPFIGWGGAVALHGARVFLFGDRTDIVDALTERELHRSGSGGTQRPATKAARD